MGKSKQFGQSIINGWRLWINIMRIIIEKDIIIFKCIIYIKFELLNKIFDIILQIRTRSSIKLI